MAKQKKILLQDLLNLSETDMKRAKVKFNIWNGYENPIDVFKSDPEILNNQWLFWNKKRKYFRVGQIAICLVRIEEDLWLFTTAKEVTRDLDIQDGISYEGKELKDISNYFGRVVIRYHKYHQGQDRMYDSIVDQLEVIQVLPDIFDDDGFPGYENVCLSYHELKRITDSGKSDWKAALENQKAVYVLTDCATGKQYVGSATAENGMLLQRWKDYVKNGHGGNKELRKLVDKKGFGYIKKNFQYSIIENFNARVDDVRILQRESYWKKVLRTKEPLGYNAN